MKLGGDRTMQLTEEQKRCLLELGATPEQLAGEFTSRPEQTSYYQSLAARLRSAQQKRLEELCASCLPPAVPALSERLAALLTNAGFIQVHTPILMTRSHLDKMRFFERSGMDQKVFWLDGNTCLRPMLAPHLYNYMFDLSKLLEGPIRLFECGPCFRREHYGNSHTSEFTMLNLVEMRIPEEINRAKRVKGLTELVLEEANVSTWRMEKAESYIYGETLDIIDGKGIKLASSAIGPLALDANWNISDNWLGIGFGLERLAMSASNMRSLEQTARSTSHLHGINLHTIPAGYHVSTHS